MPIQQIPKKDKHNACAPFIFLITLIPLIVLSAARFGGYDPIPLITKQEGAKFYFYIEIIVKTEFKGGLDQAQGMLSEFSSILGSGMENVRRSINPRFKFHYEYLEYNTELGLAMGSDDGLNGYNEIINDLGNKQQLNGLERWTLKSAWYGSILLNLGTIACILSFGFSLLPLMCGRSCGKYYVILAFIIKIITVAVPIYLKLTMQEETVKSFAFGDWFILDCGVVIICVFLMLCKWK